ncbi:MAG: hypothetical protein COZ70_11955 [Deltaproteobacteria bacterium CG_4_8_14_3_um_filter_51_11]|nr:hypothetical protein [bacterium]OIP39886.1 MAG: hypothetical protein AUK25_08995 [Desulfobacteraceae bacterium CG2_30_51_40]PIP48362.1 MAG: hypothetical protein COX16_01265 [Deltaproteobacteria bacterium CG23_combo_of_CG06-09_8_20_14_all_51_20]PIX18871.1 MAG: hypothetical protein COZ70_11955 [Deltaproteobacteria bacterium CG_4_8_14_3_um_filter_51_11]PIY27190.1 MAG: hypothetical protein COZ11_00465 [Deltaproteobacteria bacterium CG_4_10_14_3_um_filter_51_14]PJB37528.1 MAG: hypothetical prote
MKNRMGAVFAVLALILLSPMWALAGNGKGVMDGTGPAPKHDLLQGIPFEYTGTVVECNDGQGLVLYVGDEGGEEFSVVISGIGPQRYWDLMGVSRPDVTDVITVEGYKITVGELAFNVAFKITFINEEDEPGASIQLRDPDTGLPLWRKAKLKMNKKGCEE